MGSCREIITLQVGHYANFIGTHWWNIQNSSFVYKGASSEYFTNEINHDYLFREGSLSNGDVTYTPRLLVIDAKGTLGSLPKVGMLYETSSSGSLNYNPLWNEKIDLIEQLPEKKNEYLKALEEEDEHLYSARDEDKDVCCDDALQDRSLQTPVSEKIFDIKKEVKVWSDFLRPHLHPSSVFILKDVWHEDPSESVGSWGFQGGASILKKEENQEEITDRIRMLAESCESLQGFHLLTDCHNGMGGISWIIAQHLADEFGSKDLFSFLTIPPHLTSLNLSDSSFFLSSLTQCYTEMSKLSSLIIPLNLHRHSWHTSAQDVRWPYLQFEMENAYLTSSILASFLDTVTVPYRKKANYLPMTCFSDLLTPVQRKVVSASFSMPLGIGEHITLYDYLNESKALDLVSITGGCSNTSDIISECLVLRGIKNSKVASSREMKWDNAWEFYKNFRGNLSKNHLIDGISEPMKIQSPFPHIFKKEVDDQGFISQRLKFPLKSLSKVNMAAGLHQGSGIRTHLEEIYEGAASLNVSKIPKLMEEDMDQESWTDLLEDMRNLLNCYESKICMQSRESDEDDF